MKSFLLLELERRKEELRRKARPEGRSYDTGRFWISRSPAPPEKKPIVSGTDGSSNFRGFIDCLVYAVTAETVTCHGKAEKAAVSDIDVLKPYRHAEERIRSYRVALELKSALASAQDSILLIDGSLLGDMMRPPGTSSALSDDERKKITNEYLPELGALCESGNVELCAKKLRERISSEFGKKAADAQAYLEHLECLLSVKNLLASGAAIAGISKTSRSTDYFSADIPDMAIFDSLCRGEGYTVPKPLTVSDSMKRRFAAFDDFFRKQTFTVFFARLSAKGPLLKFEVPRPIKRDEAESLLDSVKSVCVSGYPYPLKKAHEDVEITAETIERITRILGVRSRTGREMLG